MLLKGRDAAALAASEVFAACAGRKEGRRSGAAERRESVFTRR
jgi:hypothetical protein